MLVWIVLRSKLNCNDSTDQSHPFAVDGFMVSGLGRGALYTAIDAG